MESLTTIVDPMRKTPQDQGALKKFVVCVRIKLEAPKKVYSIRLDVDKGHKGENNRFSCDRRPTVARLIQV